MKKHYIKVKSGIQYISDWEEYCLPKGHCIVDKGVTGCGYTEYCLRNDQNIVLCSPRKLLLENKSEQHEGDHNILYLKNDVENYEGTKNLKERAKDHYYSCCGPFSSVPVKFLVTYDSAHYLVELLGELGVLGNFTFVIDEFQSIFLDSYFKADVEFSFIESLQVCPNVLYLSATPMLEKYLNQISEFKDLDYYELDWSETGIVETMVIQRKYSQSLISECAKIIENYKVGKFPMTLVGNIPVYSKEFVFYFNSVTEIIRVINKCGLTSENTNIICSNTPENQKKLARINFTVGKVPVPSKGETNKMFTFCTRSAYIGADFYSDNAKSAVFCDPNFKSLALDISLDLPQIVGRQRDKSNPFKNDIIIFYKTLRTDNVEDRELFDKTQEERRKATKDLLEGFINLTQDQRNQYLKKLRDGIKVSQYSDDFVSISSKTGLPVYNTFIDIANERAWEVAQKDYQDKINVTCALEEVSTEVSEYRSEIEIEVQNFLDNYFYKTGLFTEKMRLYCEFMDNHSEFNQELSDLLYFKIKDDHFRTYYNYYGTSGCKAREYRDKNLELGIRDSFKETELSKLISSVFKAGNKYAKRQIKDILKTFYRDLGMNKTAKATDLGDYFKLRKTSVKYEGKFENGFELSPLFDIPEDRKVDINYGFGVDIDHP